MLGAVGAAAMAGSAASLAMLPAHAEAPVTQGSNFSGPVSFADMVDRVKGAVVAVKVNMVEKADSENPGFGGEGLPPGMPPMSPDDPLFRFFKRFGARTVAPTALSRTRTRARRSARDFIISADGYVVTNNHVVENSTEVTLTIEGGKTVPAKIIGVTRRPIWRC